MKEQFLKVNSTGLAIVLLLLMVIPFTGCIVRDSPAPGCIEYWPSGLAGGCFGKSIIKDLEVEPAVDGINIDVNNCNGGILEVDNSSDEPFMLGGIEIAPHSYNVGLDVLGQENGAWTLTRTDSNFSDYIPEEDKQIEITGKLGTREILISYTKTRELCD